MSQPLKRASSAMASSSSSLASLSSLLFSKPHHRSNPNPSSALSVPIGSRTIFKCSANSDQKRERVGDSEAVEKKSFAVATGELFIGLASKFVRRGRNSYYGNDQAAVPSIKVFDDDEEREYFSRRRRGDGRVATMIEEDEEADDREIIWEQRGANVEAEKKRKKVTSPGFSFSAAGLLFPYHLGVAQFLIEKGYIKETTPLAGSSAGAIVSVVIASGGSMLEALEATKILAEDCRNNGTAFRLGAVLRDVLDRFLPDDAHIRSNGRVRVGVTQLLWRPRGLLVDQFESKEDLINAVFTSSFIPGYLAPRPATLFRERLCIDGGLTMLMPPTSASKTVRVCAFPATLLGFKGIGISPHCNPENRAGGQRLFQWALEPAEDDVLDHLFGLGYMDAATWAKQNPVEEILENESSREESLN